jgi:hypothetical protein
MFERRSIITLVFLFIIYLGVVYTARQHKVRPLLRQGATEGRAKLLQPAATASHPAPVTNHVNLLTVQPIPVETKVHNRLN